jgi:hypothetical protein
LIGAHTGLVEISQTSLFAPLEENENIILFIFQLRGQKPPSSDGIRFEPLREE